MSAVNNTSWLPSDSGLTVYEQFNYDPEKKFPDQIIFAVTHCKSISRTCDKFIDKHEEIRRIFVESCPFGEVVDQKYEPATKYLTKKYETIGWDHLESGWAFDWVDNTLREYVEVVIKKEFHTAEYRKAEIILRPIITPVRVKLIKEKATKNGIVNPCVSKYPFFPEPGLETWAHRRATDNLNRVIRQLVLEVLRETFPVRQDCLIKAIKEMKKGDALFAGMQYVLPLVNSKRNEEYNVAGVLNALSQKGTWTAIVCTTDGFRGAIPLSKFEEFQRCKLESVKIESSKLVNPV